MSYFKAKMCQIKPRWGAYSAPPDLLAGFIGPTSKRREGRKDGRGGERREREGKVGDGGDGRGGKRKVG